MKTLHIISHTHWDREWYMSFEQHRMRLVDLLDKLIDTMEKNEDYKYFHMDGQYIVVEDYLEIKPYMRDRLLKLIQDDRIQIGPWYILQDEYLTSGEANVRNMLYGLKLCKEFGARPVMCGYFPDAFGNISQAPQILQGFGIDNSVFGRGLNEIGADNEVVRQNGINKSEFIWRSPDGSEVVGVMFANWYHNAMELPTDIQDLKQRLTNIIHSTSKFAVTPNLLGMNGCDHQPIQANLHEVLSASNGLIDGVTVEHSNFNKYIDEIKKHKDSLIVVEGEIAGQFTNGNQLLINTASSRVYLKQLNHKAENLLERLAEPLNVLSYINGDEYHSDFLLYSWKTLMQNHPHDSICGCSVDEVHCEMITRFNKSIQVADGVKNKSIAYIAKNINTTELEEKNIVVFYLDPYKDVEVVKTYVDFSLEDNIEGLTITDTNGNIIPSSIKNIGRTFWIDLPDDSFRKHGFVNRFEIQMLVEGNNGLGYNTYLVKKQITPIENKIIYRDNFAENEFMEVYIKENGSIKLIDKKTGNVYDNLNIYESTGDIGDEYNFIQSEDKTIFTTKKDDAKITIFEATPFSVTFKVENILNIPLRSVEKNRSDEVIPHTITTYLTLTKGIDRLDICTEIDNQSENHRLRALFCSDIESNFVYADGQFDVVKREITPWNGWENPSNDQRCQAFFAIENEHKGLLVATKGLNEYEVLRDDKNTMALTLLRCVGTLGDWGVFPTPDAQCKGKQSFNYSIVLYNYSSKKQAYRNAYKFNSEAVFAIQTGKHSGLLQIQNCYLSIDNGFIKMSSLKKCEDRNSLILRLYNTSETAQQVKININDIFNFAYNTNLNEDRIGEILINNNDIDLNIGAKKIITIELLKEI